MKIVTTFQITNFKAFGAAQRMPLRPITLIYGANSAGKSSILHALALVHHAMETGNLDTQRTQIGGESIDLGGFRQYVHRRRRENPVGLAFEMTIDRLSGRMAEILRPAREVVIELAIGGGFTGEQLDLFGDATRELDSEGRVRVERFSLQVDGDPLLSMSIRQDGLFQLDRLSHNHPMFREILRRILTSVTTVQEIHTEDFDELSGVLDDFVPKMTARQRGIFPRIEDKQEGTLDHIDRGLFRPFMIVDQLDESKQNMLAISRDRRRRDLAHATRLVLPGILHDLVGNISSILETEIRKLVYLGPLRSYPPRHLVASQHHDPNWFSGGGYAWDVIRTREDVRKRVNEWLGDSRWLKTPYQLEIRDLVSAASLPEELSPKLEAAVHGLVRRLLDAISGGEHSELLTETIETLQLSDLLGLGDEGEMEELVNTVVDIEDLSREWIKQIVESHPDGLRDLILVDKRSGTALSHRDVGIGVSQVLPVLVSAYASSGKLIAIEQPEIHLHPALQAELGDVFLESALGAGGNTLVIESHSEHLLLRIMRRMRETSAGNLPDGIPEVRPEDVMVLFVEPDGEQSLIREMPLNERGELVKAWPGGFFEEDLREIF